MDSTYIFLQHYWWFLVSLLGALLVFLLFVQGGNSLLYCLGRTEEERTLLVNSTGRKWEFTFTTLVTFGGAFFASFPLFYSTSFGGAYWLWMITFFNGSNFVVSKGNLTEEMMPVISHWGNGWHGLDAFADPWNLILGFAVLFLARLLGNLYFINNIRHETLNARFRRQLIADAVPFLVFCLAFVIRTLLKDGFAVNPETGQIVMEPFKYFHNFIAMPYLLVLFLLGVVGVLYGLGKSIFCKTYTRGIWFAGVGTVLTVLALLLVVGYNHTAYYPSTADLQSSLTIANSCSSQFTLKTMAYVSILVPFVLAYIIYAWRAIDRKPLTMEEIKEDEHSY